MKFSLFPKKPITKDDKYAEIPTNFVGFFVMLKRKFWNISNLSLVFTLFCFPVFFLLAAYSLQEPVTVVTSPMHSAFFGFSSASASDGAVLKSLFSFVNGYGTSMVPSTASYICFGISALFIPIFGLASAGAAYAVRGYNRGDPVFLFSDFISTIKRNRKQGIIMGILDLLFCYLLVYDFIFWQTQPGFLGAIMMYFALFLCVIYLFMRFYIYTIMITFDLSIFKILKNAFLLSFLGFKRNFVALFGIIFTLYLNLLLFFVSSPIGIALPIIITFGLVMFMSGYASYPVIKKYMIDPYYPDGEEPEEIVDDDESAPDAVFEDRG